jgi:UDP-N-acetylglucosamine/UDP-N-acetylgalactosamine diphosphorylase
VPDAAPTTSADLDALRDRLAAVGQEHLLTFADELAPAQLRTLIADIDAIPLDRVPDWVDRYVRNKPDFGAPDPSAIEPPPTFGLDSDWDRDACRRAGEDLLRKGQVAAFTVAGGQGSRLGYDGPKGCFPGGAVTGKPLFRMFSEWILAAQDRFGSIIPWYIMTSPLNHETTTAFFDDNKFFGLDRRNVMFFPQGVMPSFDRDSGRILLAEKHRVATNPDGHGGSLRALHTSGALDDMKGRGVTQISYFQVDNPVARVVDPLFLGVHAAAPESSGEMTTKVVAKQDPAEKVGVLCAIDGRTQVIEYSDLPDDLAAKRADDGSLLLDAGNIAIHAISVDFVESLNAGGELALPFHRADKKVPHIDLDTGEPVDPAEPNAVKLEMFVFDAIPKAKASAVFEVDRVEEFAPIKNAEGSDSPTSSARLQTQRAARWIEHAGGSVPRTADGEPDCTLELSPLTAMEPGDLQQNALPTINPGDTVAL